MATEQRTEDVSVDGAGQTGGESLTVTDNRTGKSYELPITDGTVKTMDLRQIKVSEDDFGLMGYDPAFTNTASCRSAITYIDGEAGILQHRGYPIEQLCEQSTYLEVAYLLVYGELPTQAQLDLWIHDVTHHTFVHEDIKKFLEGFRYDAHPMGMLLASVGALSTFYPDAKKLDDPEERYLATIRLIAKMPTMAAFAYRHNMGLPYVYPDNDLSYPENFLGMLFKMTESKYQPDERLARALDVLFILHADHEQNCSTNAVRAVGSSDVDPYSAVAAGIAALYGPLHGGANEAVLRMLRRIETVENIPDFLEGVKKREERLMGFGHRVYKNYDPRARIIKKHMDGVMEATAYNPLVEIATELEKRALEDDYFTSRKLYPNVDFYSGIIYEALRIPTEMFTVIFAIPRTSGWIAQWLEMNDDSEKKIARPRQIYTGERDVDYVPISERSGPETIEGPPARRPIRLSGQGRGARALRCPRARLEADGPPRLRGQPPEIRRPRRCPRAGSPRGRGAEGGGAAARRSRCCASSSPAAQVHARLEISGKGLIRPPTAGVDLRGDGSLVAFSGSLAREELKPDRRREPLRAGPPGARAGVVSADFEVPEGSVAVGRRVRLPRGAEPPFAVFINGVRQQLGADYEIHGGEVVFSRPILKEKKLGGIRWLSMLVGVAGTYRKHETVDVQFTRAGKTELVSDLEVLPD